MDTPSSEPTKRPARSCRDGSRCINLQCQFAHPENWTQGSAECSEAWDCSGCDHVHPPGWKPHHNFGSGWIQDCRHGLNCNNLACTFDHPNEWYAQNAEHIEQREQHKRDVYANAIQNTPGVYFPGWIDMDDFEIVMLEKGIKDLSECIFPPGKFPFKLLGLVPNCKYGLKCRNSNCVWAHPN